MNLQPQMPNSLKAIIYFCIMALIVILIAALPLGCQSAKKVTEIESTSKSIEKSEKVSDSTSNKQVNGAIKDQITTPVGTTGDAKCDDKIDEILKKLNTSKSSGGNSYKLRYDEETRQLLIDFIIAQTESEQVNTNTSSVSESTFEEKTDTYISKKIRSIPWWFWVGLIIWFLPQIIEKVVLISTPFGAVINKFKK